MISGEERKMTNYEKYVKVFEELFNVSKEEAEKLEYMSNEEWDSVGHMGLIAELEDTFDIQMDTDDIIDFNSFEKGIEILKKYNIILEA
jgi:acyl carrier protein